MNTLDDEIAANTANYLLDNPNLIKDWLTRIDDCEEEFIGTIEALNVLNEALETIDEEHGIRILQIMDSSTTKPFAKQILKERINDSREWCHRYAIYALACLSADKSTLETVREQASTNDRATLVWCLFTIATLLEFDEFESVEFLEGYLQHEDDELRAIAILGLANRTPDLILQQLSNELDGQTVYQELIDAAELVDDSSIKAKARDILQKGQSII